MEGEPPLAGAVVAPVDAGAATLATESPDYLVYGYGTNESTLMCQGYDSLVGTGP